MNAVVLSNSCTSRGRLLVHAVRSASQLWKKRQFAAQKKMSKAQVHVIQIDLGKVGAVARAVSETELEEMS